MRELFRCWRRKAGCVTLAIAIGLTSLWMRSYIFVDCGYLPTYSFGSFRGGVFLVYHPEGTALAWNWDTTAYEDVLPKETDGMSLGQILDWEFGSEPESFYCFTMYWRLVLPLTIASAYLVLWKPQKFL